MAAGRRADGSFENECVESYRLARNDLRQVVVLLRLSGPDELAEAAHVVREAERRFRATRFACDDGGEFDQDKPPKIVLQAAHDFEDAVHEFALLARRYAS
ncbi:hypothetical protein Lesp02_03430 [Lentzea sp. NBRC 105346]|nr:hypothetical protein Lesp02_03430 [Lentzea sp. NBRC 105346]